ncbi:hypothetical protein AcdelDRAFT_4668 [Acidovorax delafieldii 2AN]|uniref:Uncharacterized protein n=1 Tax=Acidovorax delafieldii 2AN TaxID=573060 RepID=C5TCN7_ACIDE|nr:hypothetical protein AcdelDRAFT_4668 [Acidovorax delafieldii 2AN]
MRAHHAGSVQEWYAAVTGGRSGVGIVNGDRGITLVDGWVDSGWAQGPAAALR